MSQFENSSNEFYNLKQSTIKTWGNKIAIIIHHHHHHHHSLAGRYTRARRISSNAELSKWRGTISQTRTWWPSISSSVSLRGRSLLLQRKSFRDGSVLSLWIRASRVLRKTFQWSRSNTPGLSSQIDMVSSIWRPMCNYL